MPAVLEVARIKFGFLGGSRKVSGHKVTSGESTTLHHGNWSRPWGWIAATVFLGWDEEFVSGRGVDAALGT